MNSLSWMIYLADVTQGVGIATLLSSCAAVVCGGIATIVYLTHRFEEPSTYRCDTTEEKDAKIARWNDSKAFAGKLATRLLIGGACLALVTSLIPSSTTIYAIAASEMGEDVLKTPTATKAMKALDAWLDRQIAGEKAEASK